MPPPTLHILSWNEPLLPQAVAWLAGAWKGGAPLDLSDQLIVVPTRQTGRRLREALAAHAGRQGQAVFPPRVLSPDGLLREVAPEAGVATRLEALLAWVEVLRSIDLAAFDEVFPVAPPVRNFAWAARVARAFLHLQQTLAENNLRMADVPARGAGGEGGFPEVARWTQLATLEARYDEALARRGRRDAEAVRIAAVARASPPPGVRRIVLLATPDPQAAAVMLLAAWARAVPVDVAVFGPPEPSARELFDAWGRPRPEAWAMREWSPPDFANRVHLCADPAAQAERVAAAAADGAAADGWLALGVADPEIIAPLHNGLGRAGVVAYDPEGRPRRAEPLYYLLHRLLTLARETSFDTVAALARCPDVLAWLRATIGPAFSSARLLAGLDDMQARHLPPSLAAARQHAAAFSRDHPELPPALDAFVRAAHRARARPVSRKCPRRARDDLPRPRVRVRATRRRAGRRCRDGMDDRDARDRRRRPPFSGRGDARCVGNRT